MTSMNLWAEDGSRWGVASSCLPRAELSRHDSRPVSFLRAVEQQVAGLETIGQIVGNFRRAGEALVSFVTIRLKSRASRVQNRSGAGPPRCASRVRPLPWDACQNPPSEIAEVRPTRSAMELGPQDYGTGHVYEYQIIVWREFREPI